MFYIYVKMMGFIKKDYNIKPLSGCLEVYIRNREMLVLQQFLLEIGAGGVGGGDEWEA